MPDLFHVPDAEHPDHPDEADRVQDELPASQFFTVKPGFQRDRHQLIHGTHDDRANPTQHKEVGRSDDVLVVVIGSEQSRFKQQADNAGAQRQQSRDGEGQGQGNGSRAG
jgi:hypothetical protein